MDRSILSNHKSERGYPLDASDPPGVVVWAMGETAKPQAGIDYPRTLTEFDKFFGNGAACREYLIRLRWASGFVGERCGSRVGAWTASRGYLHFRACGDETSIAAGTVFQDTRSPLRTWFLAMWFVTSQKDGVSALGLKQALGLSSDQSAWTWLHKLRRAMVRPNRERLTGVVEVDALSSHLGGQWKSGI